MAVYHLCRICLTEDTNIETMQPLFEEDNTNCDEIVRKIEECGGIVLKAHDGFPKMICDQCLHSLDTSYKFRTMCQASEHALLDVIVKSEMKAEPQENALHIGVDPTKAQEQSDIFFDLRNQILDGEEVDLDILADKSVYEDSIPDCETFTSETEDSNDDCSTYIDKRKKVLKLLSNKRHSNKRGRPRLKSVAIKKSKKGEECHNRKKRDDNQYQIMCEICGNIYPKSSKLSLHMRRHLSEKPFECEICSKTFACPSEIKRHMRVHTGEKPFVCKYCGRTFADRSTNIKHERIHTKERPFSCKTCGKTFTYSNVLKNHMLTHTGEKPFSCIPCKKTFSRKHQLEQHNATLTHQHTMQSLANTEHDGSEGEMLRMKSEILSEVH